MSDYNGWSNRATWNVALWLDNEESTYREVQALQRLAKSHDEFATTLQELCEAIWVNGKTPDDDLLSECDWKEIAEHAWEDSDHETPAEPSTTSPEPGSLSKFVVDQGIVMLAHRVSKRQDGLMSEEKEQTGRDARHFRCIFTHFKKAPAKVRRTMGVYFSQGSAHITPPTIEDVLDCLASDASSYENAKTFEEWAGEYGYDTDSRKAEKTYKAVKRASEQLKRFLGKEAYDTLLYKTERL